MCGVRLGCWNIECSYNFDCKCEHRGVSNPKYCQDYLSELDYEMAQEKKALGI